MGEQSGGTWTITVDAPSYSTTVSELTLEIHGVDTGCQITSPSAFHVIDEDAATKTVDLITDTTLGNTDIYLYNVSERTGTLIETTSISASTAVTLNMDTLEDAYYRLVLVPQGDSYNPLSFIHPTSGVFSVGEPALPVDPTDPVDPGNSASVPLRCFGLVFTLMVLLVVVL
ncbi:hypothetical protein KIPB_006903 [Kipferlia bialata]|uniref:Uncharacterized protein n=1 Tax=Kipferlia bialata TaxID=797122 RepID=A0A9K3D0Y3_9EUKA|nr:hypothetical protein KIPB_006903 [Kipferlia bialata]|eukprot:g6903.t1